MDIDVSAILKVCRINEGRSLSEVATLTGISAGTIKSYEEGLTEPNLKNLVKLLKAFNLPLDEFLIKEEDINIKKDDILYTKKFQRGLEVLYQGRCLDCNEERYLSEKEMKSSVPANCNNCKRSVFKNLTQDEVNALNTLFKSRIIDRSIRCGLNCTITLDDYLKTIIEPCYYCGEKPSQEDIICGKKFLHNGIDRINNSRGYEKDNIVSCCTRCNMAKGSLTKEEFLNLAEKITNNQKK